MSILPFCKKGSSWIITFEDFELRGLRGESHTAVVWQLFESGQFDFEAAFEPTMFLCIDPSVLFWERSVIHHYSSLDAAAV